MSKILLNLTPEEVSRLPEVQRVAYMRAYAEDFIQRFNRRHYKIAYSIVANREDATDCVQEAYLSVFRAIDRFDPLFARKRREASGDTSPMPPLDMDAALDVWVNRNIINKARDRAEKNAHEQHAAAGHARLMSSAPEERCDEIAAEREEVRNLREALGKLTEHDRDIVTRVYINDECQVEVAQSYGYSYNTFRRKLKRARGSLRFQMLQVNMVNMNASPKQSQTVQNDTRETRQAA